MELELCRNPKKMGGGGGVGVSRSEFQVAIRGGEFGIGEKKSRRC